MFHTISDSHGDRLSNVNTSLHKYVFITRSAPTTKDSKRVKNSFIAIFSALLLNSTIGIVVFINVAGTECCVFIAI